MQLLCNVQNTIALQPTGAVIHAVGMKLISGTVGFVC